MIGSNDEQNELSVKTESISLEGPKKEALKPEEQIQEVPKVSQREAKVEPKKTSFLNVVHDTGVVAAKTVAGVGIGAAMGIGAVVAIAAAEVIVPSLLVVQIFGFAGGAVGFLKGISKK